MLYNETKFFKICLLGLKTPLPTFVFSNFIVLLELYSHFMDETYLTRMVFHLFKNVPCWRLFLIQIPRYSPNITVWYFNCRQNYILLNISLFISLCSAYSRFWNRFTIGTPHRRAESILFTFSFFLQYKENQPFKTLKNEPEQLDLDVLSDRYPLLYREFDPIFYLSCSIHIQWVKGQET